MTDLRILPGVSSVTRVTGDGTQWMAARGTRDGSLFACDWIQALVLEGRVYMAYVGSATTPITLDASWANTDPDISLDVPDGTAIIPLAIKVVLEAFGTTALFETMTLVSRTLAASSAGTAFTPINIRTDAPQSSNCSVYVGPTVTSGYTTGAFELHRDCLQKAATISTADDDQGHKPNLFEWTLGQNGFAPVLVGPASMATWATSQAASGYIQYYWAEVPENSLK